ncbi:hypothetical protein JL722_4358 [Aureococcus anophagefferens]|nr:hypothetical protein JL722_4358 [Aureococcus anophagefferens]
MPPPRYGKASKASKKEEKKPSGPSQAELLAKAREAQIAERDRVRKEREAAAQQRREAGKNKKPGAGSRQSIRDLKKEHAAKKEAEAAALGTDGRSWKAMTKSKARLAAEEAYMAKLMDDDESEREKYTSFCAHIAATEMEVWVEEVFAGASTRTRTARSRSTTSNSWEGREGSSSVRRLFEVVDCIDQDGSITMQEWVQFLANLWHFGGDDLVESTLTNFENLISFRENAEIEAMERALLEAEAAQRSALPTGSMLEGGGGAEAKRRSSLDMSGIVEDRYTEAASIGLYERMDAVFEGMDFDGNGTIEKEELAELIQDDEVSAEIMPLLDNIDEDDTITKEEFRLFFDLMGKGVGETGVEACLITFENLLRLRGNKMSEAYELKRKESMQKASGGAAVPALQGVRPQSARRRPSGGLSGRRTPRSSRSGKSLRLHLTPRKDVKPGDKRSSNLPTRDDPTPRELLDSGRLDSSRLNSARGGGPFKYRGANSGDTLASPQPSGRRRSLSGSHDDIRPGSRPATPPDAPGSLKPKPPGSPKSLPTLSIGEASAAALKAALGSARSSVNPTPRSSSTPRTARVTPRRMFSRSNAGSMYTPFHARSSPRHKKKAADKADAKAGS